LLSDAYQLEKHARPTDILGDKVYSLGWTMMQPGEKCFEFLTLATTMTTIPKAFDTMDNDSKLSGGYRGVTVNVIMADTEGNIGYQLLAPIPIRKNKTPFLGLRVLNGRTSAYDWEENGKNTVPLSELPRSLNPSKGYIVSANNKQSSEHHKHDYGSSLWPTPRAERASELIEAKIKAGEKLTFQDMKDF
jgi:penicillin amidase